MQENISLLPYNTFGIFANAKYFTLFSSTEDLKNILQSTEVKTNGLCILGGGSNILLTKDVDKVVLKNELKGIEIIIQNNEVALVKCAAGEVWHSFVLWCIENNLYGVENLSLIPGTVGAAPMQNIGAYGVEIKDVFFELEAMQIDSLQMKTFNQAQCEFGYRESFFKRKGKDQYIITSVTFQLNKKANLNASYGAIQEVLTAKQIENPTAKDISNAVIEIRQSKLPDPKDIGNAGSFFKNPEIATKHFLVLKKVYPSMPGYTLTESLTKVPAGWLIEQCGWKGFRKDDLGVHAKQALVLVNYKQALGAEIYNLSTQILESVKNKFDIVLEREVNIW
ncbi:MAG: UDP-N-acetylmuramate dehydrogenase [Chitinophagaceae bacterium]|nr:UDP-N-acetylmuramate dehydrogenase [Chitinophagaceae bacterium]